MVSGDIYIFSSINCQRPMAQGIGRKVVNKNPESRNNYLELLSYLLISGTMKEMIGFFYN